MSVPSVSTPPPLAPVPEQAKATAQERPSVDPLNLEQVLSTCRWCWGHHPGVCPYIRQVEWHPSGQVARVILKERIDHEKTILYPDDEASAEGEGG